jgi:hypothetical protein
MAAATAALSSLRLQWAQQEGTGCVAATMAPVCEARRRLVGLATAED